MAIIGGAIVSTVVGVAGAGGVAAFTFLGMTGIGAIAASLLVSTAMGAALNALAPKIASASRGYSLTGESGSALDHQIIYGKAKVGGVRVYDVTTNRSGDVNDYLHRILVFAGHEITSYDEIYLNNELLTIVDAYTYTVEYPSIIGGSTITKTVTIENGSYNIGDRPRSGDIIVKINDPVATGQAVFGRVVITAKASVGSKIIEPEKYTNMVRIKKYYGTEIQEADPDLITATQSLALDAGRWTVDHKLSGLAYLYVRFDYDPDTFPNGVPVISTVIKGKKVYDPRDGSTAWSNNPALCLRDYISSGYGLDVPDARISDAEVITAASICDDTVINNLGSTTRYTCDGAFVTAFPPSQIISDITTSMGGLFWYSQGKWRMKAAAWVAPTVTLTEDDLRSSISVVTRHSRRDTFNTIKGRFKGAESDWQEADYPEVSSAAAIAADNNIVNTSDFGLPFTTSSIVAQRLAKIFLFRNREQLTISASFGTKAFQVEVGDIINISLTRFGWSPKTFEVTSWSFGLTEGLDLQVNMTLREISSQVFDNVDGSIFEINNTTLPSAFNVPPIGIVTTSETVVKNEVISQTLYANITSALSTSVERVEVQYKLSSASIWNAMGVGDLGVYQVTGLATGTYDVQARAYSQFGVKGSWVLRPNFQVVDNLPTPAVVTGFSKNISKGTLTLSWIASSSPDLSYYRIKHTALTTGALWSNAATIVDKISRPATSVTLTIKPGTYMIKAYTKGDKPSPDPASLVITTASLVPYTNNINPSENLNP